MHGSSSKQPSACIAAGKLVLKQMVCDSRAFSAGISCMAMALSNYHLFVADSKGSIYTLRCDIKNGMLLVRRNSLSNSKQHLVYD